MCICTWICVAVFLLYLWLYVDWTLFIPKPFSALGGCNAWASGCCLLGLWQALTSPAPRAVGCHGGELPKHLKIWHTRWHDLWRTGFFARRKVKKSIGPRVNFGEVNLGLVRFFGHPAFALAPYKCDYFTSFTQGTDGPPSPTVETFFDLENPTMPSPFTFSSKISLPFKFSSKQISSCLHRHWQQDILLAAL